MRTARSSPSPDAQGASTQRPSRHTQDLAGCAGGIVEQSIFLFAQWRSEDSCNATNSSGAVVGAQYCDGLLQQSLEGREPHSLSWVHESSGFTSGRREAAAAADGRVGAGAAADTGF